MNPIHGIIIPHSRECVKCGVHAIPGRDLHCPAPPNQTTPYLALAYLATSSPCLHRQTVPYTAMHHHVTSDQASNAFNSARNAESVLSVARAPRAIAADFAAVAGSSSVSVRIGSNGAAQR